MKVLEDTKSHITLKLTQEEFRILWLGTRDLIDNPHTNRQHEAKMLSSKMFKVIEAESMRKGVR